ncbi:hypothetical protein ACFXKX_23730 [Streptomyces scopuliridis]|uniref:hypothetical protein n=1 Tax=Streptomyces scopuliridis TaxID=452529 RepID=UPI0036AA0E5B
MTSDFHLDDFRKSYGYRLYLNGHHRDRYGMIRTPAQHRRRRGLGNAAAGRTAVILYACIEDVSASAAATFEDLRLFAHARDWVIAGEFLDRLPLSTPLRDRPQWQSVLNALAAGPAEGIVAALDPTHDQDDDARAHLLEHLADRGAFLSTVSRDAVPQGRS